MDGDGVFYCIFFVVCNGFFFDLWCEVLVRGVLGWYIVFYGRDGWFLGFYLEIVILLDVFLL